ncbi:hypothetical protein LTR99_011059 [Exophiala xenobiotica]|nr:hypothetical protein LTR99_011059 [Exophiala xenobiotica]KAK5313023.1 hypothetical protein LTR93_011090 [Exophiala xenobiotica]
MHKLNPSSYQVRVEYRGHGLDFGPLTSPNPSNAMDPASCEIKLHSFFRSTSTARVRIAAHLKNIPLEYVYVNVRQDAHLEQAFGELNPNKTVPVLTVKTKEGHSPIVISQSVAILEFFEEAFVHRRPLLPPQTDLAGRAKVRELVGIVACDIQPPTNRRILQKIKKCGSSPSMEEWAREIMDAGLAAFDKLAKPCAGRYCYGDEITLADVVLVPAIGNAVRYGVDIAAYPTIHRISETLAENEAFKAGGWQNQADTPEEERLG